MTEEILETVEETDHATNYIDELNKVKSTMVDKNKYDNLVAENKKLANALANGISIEPEIKESVDIEALEKDLHKRQPNDLVFFTKALKLRDARLALNENDDIFVSPADDVDESDYIAAQNFADAIKEAIDDSNGDPRVFEAKLPQPKQGVRRR